ncbi:hypothetical protein [Thalassobius sp. I31.1]|uniref:DUF6630 family protein n=1 Tax=Thalassobius sp. I31.1 TaxID=2109912 RepID=UPI000D198937|nr:hypothetical protein [Thalassobius sp. I31.1]
MYYKEMKAASPLQSEVITIERLCACLDAGFGAKAAEYKGLQRLACITVFPYDDNRLSVSLTYVGDEIDVRQYKKDDLVNWNSDDLMTEVLQTFRPVTDIDLIRQIENAFEKYVAEKEHTKLNAVEENQPIPLKTDVDRDALAKIVAILEGNERHASEIVDQVEQAAIDPVTYLTDTEELVGMTSAMCQAFSWKNAFFEGLLYDRNRIVSLDWKGDAQDLEHLVNMVCSIDIDLKKAPLEEASALLPIAGKQLRKNRLALLEYQTNTDAHFFSIIDLEGLKPFLVLAKHLGLDVINHSKRTWFGNFS